MAAFYYLRIPLRSIHESDRKRDPERWPKGKFFQHDALMAMHIHDLHFQEGLSISIGNNLV